MKAEAFERALRERADPVIDPVTKSVISYVELMDFLIHNVPDHGSIKLVQNYQGDQPRVHVSRDGGTFTIRPGIGIMGALCARLSVLLSESTSEMFYPSSGDGVLHMESSPKRLIHIRYRHTADENSIRLEHVES